MDRRVSQVKDAINGELETLHRDTKVVSSTTEIDLYLRSGQNNWKSYPNPAILALEAQFKPQNYIGRTYLSHITNDSDVFVDCLVNTPQDHKIHHVLHFLQNYIFHHLSCPN